MKGFNNTTRSISGLKNVFASTVRASDIHTTNLNADSISGLTITDLQNEINQNKTDIITIQNNQNDYQNQINQNDADIESLETTTAQNSSDIQTNATNISNNLSSITTNQTNISNNATNISTNETNINNNLVSITTNQLNISNNANAISLNASKITDLENKQNSPLDRLIDQPVALVGTNKLVETEVSGNFNVSGVTTVDEIRTGDVVMTTNKIIVQQTNTQWNSLSKTQISDLEVLSSLVLPSDIQIEGSTHTSDLVLDNASIQQTNSASKINTLQATDFYSGNVRFSNDIIMLGGNANLQNLTVTGSCVLPTFTSPTITNIQNQIDSNDTELTNLQNQINSNDTELSSLQAQINSNDTELSSLQSQVNSNDTELSSLQSQISSNDTEISALQNDKANISSPTFRRLINYRSGDSYGMYFDYNTYTSTVDFNCRYQLSESYNPTINGGGLLQFWGNQNFKNGSLFFDNIELKKDSNKLVISHEIDSPTITTIEQQITDLQNESDGHGTNTTGLQGQINTINTNVSNNDADILANRNNIIINTNSIVTINTTKADLSNPVFPSSLFIEDIEIKKQGTSLYVGAEIDSYSIHEIHDNNGLTFYKNDYIVSNNGKTFVQPLIETTIAQINVTKTFRGKIKIDTPVSLQIGYQNWNSDINLFNRFEAQINNIQYFIYRNGSLFSTGDCTENETLVSIHTQVASNTAPGNEIDIFVSNFNLEFTPDTVAITDNNTYVYEIKFKIFSTFNASWQAYNFKYVGLNFDVNTNISTATVGLNISSGQYGQNYSAFSDELIPILANDFTHNKGVAYVNHMMTNTLYMNEKLVATQDYTVERKIWVSNWLKSYQGQEKSFSFHVGTGHVFEDFFLEIFARTPTASSTPVGTERRFKLANSEETDRGISYNASYSAGWYHVDIKMGSAWIFRAYMFDTFHLLWPHTYPESFLLQQSGQYATMSNAWIGCVLRKY